MRSILITSAGPGEGKSSCAAHMAIAHAERGKKTLLIDADLRRPSQHTFFNLSNDLGLADAMASGCSLKEIRQSINGFDTLDVIVAGKSSDRSYLRVGSTVAQLLTMARGEYDLILIDAPPMLFLAEPIQIACLADGVLVVSNAEQTRYRSVARVLTILRRVHANIIGIVLNEIRLDMSSSYQPYRDYEKLRRRILPKAG
jgi:capsular exopolysaccharide synthesis family protein